MTALEEPSSMVELRDVHKQFEDVKVLRGIDLEVARGDVVAIIGPSGGGKSTLLRCVNLLERPTSGRVVVEGNDITDPATDLNAVRRRVGMVFQQYNLFPHLTVLQNLTLASRKLLKKDRASSEDQAERLLSRVGLSGKRGACPTSSPGGSSSG